MQHFYYNNLILFTHRVYFRYKNFSFKFSRTIKSKRIHNFLLPYWNSLTASLQKVAAPSPNLTYIGLNFSFLELWFTAYLDMRRLLFAFAYIRYTEKSPEFDCIFFYFPNKITNFQQVKIPAKRILRLVVFKFHKEYQSCKLRIIICFVWTKFFMTGTKS